MDNLTRNIKTCANIYRFLQIFRITFFLTGRCCTIFDILTSPLTYKRLIMLGKWPLKWVCVHRILLYGRESWPLYMHQERRLNISKMRCLRKILGISWHDHITNKDILAKTNVLAKFSVLSQRRLRWPWLHIVRIRDDRIPKDILYSKLETSSRPTGRPHLRFKDVCKRDIKSGSIATADLEPTAADCEYFRLYGQDHREVRRGVDVRPEGGKAKPSTSVSNNVRNRWSWRVPNYTWSNCNRICRSCVGLLSHSRRCRTGPNFLAHLSIVSRDERTPSSSSFYMKIENEIPIIQYNFCKWK